MDDHENKLVVLKLVKLYLVNLWSIINLVDSKNITFDASLGEQHDINILLM